MKSEKSLAAFLLLVLISSHTLMFFAGVRSEQTKQGVLITQPEGISCHDWLDQHGLIHNGRADDSVIDPKTLAVSVKVCPYATENE